MMPQGRGFDPAGSSTGPVEVYGTAWCGATQAVRRYLDRHGIAYDWVDLDRDPTAAARVAWLTGGDVSHPTVAIDGEVLVEPPMSELEAALSRAGLT